MIRGKGLKKTPSSCAQKEGGLKRNIQSLKKCVFLKTATDKGALIWNFRLK